MLHYGGRRKRHGHDWARWRAVAVFLALFAAGGGTVWWTMQHDRPIVTTAAAPCSTTVPKPVAAASPKRSGPAPASIHVTVLNGTGRNGLATQTAHALAARGFKLGRVSNALVSVPGTALIRSGPRGVAQARALAKLVPGARLVRDDRHARSVDLVLGAKFHGLAHPVRVVRVAATTAPCPSGSPSSSRALAH